MEEDLTKGITHMSSSQNELVRIVRAQKRVALHMAGLISEIPDDAPFQGSVQSIMKHTSHMTKNVAAYLNSLADLEEALAVQLELLMKEIMEPGHDE